MNNTIIETRLKAYCGYLRNKTPMQAARIKKQLDKVTCYTVDDNDSERTIRTTEADFVVKMLYGENREPRATEAHIEQSTGKKVKAYYGLYIERYSYEVNKTTYDFALYLRDNFKTFEEAIEADTAEYTRLENERAEEDRKALEAAEAEKRQEETEAEMQATILKTAEALIGSKVHEVTKSVLSRFNWYDGSPNTDKRFMMLYAMAQNIENPFVKSELCSLLHNDNKASIQLFGLFSGVNMPKTHKERIDLVNRLKQADIRSLVKSESEV